MRLINLVGLQAWGVKMASKYSAFRTQYRYSGSKEGRATSYFIVNEYDDSAIKIGHTSGGYNGVIKRKGNFEVGTFRDYYIVAHSYNHNEIDLHNMFSDIRVRPDREMFWATHELLKWIYLNAEVSIFGDKYIKKHLGYCQPEYII